MRAELIRTRWLPAMGVGGFHGGVFAYGPLPADFQRHCDAAAQGRLRDVIGWAAAGSVAAAAYGLVRRSGSAR